MANLKWFIILFIGMIGLTGFSTTTDLNQDSSITTTSDVDVGYVIYVVTTKDVKFIEDYNKSVFPASSVNPNIIHEKVTELNLNKIINKSKLILVKNYFCKPRDKLKLI